MQTKIGVEILKFGDNTENILKIVATHNEGKRVVMPEDIECYLRVRDALYPTCNNDLAYWDKEADRTIRISSDKGKSYSLILTWKEIHELKDDLPSDLYTKGVSETEMEIIEELEQKNLS